MAGRGYGTAQAAAAIAEVTAPVYFVDLDFVGGFVRACDAPFAISWDVDGDGNAEQFLGLGDVGAITEFSEDTEGQVTSVTVTLSGVKRSLVALARAEGASSQGRAGKIYKGFLGDDNQLVGLAASPVELPVLQFAGIIDTMSISVGTQYASIALRIKSRAFRWEQGRDQAWFSDGYHRSRYPKDTYFSRAAEIERGVERFWGVADP